MKMNIYAMQDVKANAFGQPFFSPNDGLALRSVSDLVADRNSMPAKHPQDFNIFKLGVYDDNSGRIEANAVPVFVAKCLDFVSQSNSK